MRKSQVFISLLLLLLRASGAEVSMQDNIESIVEKKSIELARKSFSQALNELPNLSKMKTKTNYNSNYYQAEIPVENFDLLVDFELENIFWNQMSAGLIAKKQFSEHMQNAKTFITSTQTTLVFTFPDVHGDLILMIRIQLRGKGTYHYERIFLRSEFRILYTNNMIVTQCDDDYLSTECIQNILYVDGIVTEDIARQILLLAKEACDVERHGNN